MEMHQVSESGSSVQQRENNIYYIEHRQPRNMQRLRSSKPIDQLHPPTPSFSLSFFFIMPCLSCCHLGVKRPNHAAASPQNNTTASKIFLSFFFFLHIHSECAIWIDPCHFRSLQSFGLLQLLHNIQLRQLTHADWSVTSH